MKNEEHQSGMRKPESGEQTPGATPHKQVCKCPWGRTQEYGGERGIAKGEEEDGGVYLGQLWN